MTQEKSKTERTGCAAFLLVIRLRYMMAAISCLAIQLRLSATSGFHPLSGRRQRDYRQGNRCGGHQAKQESEHVSHHKKHGAFPVPFQRLPEAKLCSVLRTEKARRGEVGGLFAVT